MCFKIMPTVFFSGTVVKNETTSNETNTLESFIRAMNIT